MGPARSVVEPDLRQRPGSLLTHSLAAALFHGEQITRQKVVGMSGITIGLAIVAIG